MKGKLTWELLDDDGTVLERVIEHVPVNTEGVTIWFNYKLPEGYWNLTPEEAEAVDKAFEHHNKAKIEAKPCPVRTPSGPRSSMSL